MLWNEDAGAWLDYDLINNKPRPYFVPTNLSPLWMRCYDSNQRQHIADRVVHYINETKLDDYPGGIPTTVYHSGKLLLTCLGSCFSILCYESTGEQWDWPNVWAPLQHMLIVGLDNLDDDRTKRIAQDWAQRWVLGNYMAFKETGAMFEKVVRAFVFL